MSTKVAIPEQQEVKNCHLQRQYWVPNRVEFQVRSRVNNNNDNEYFYSALM